MNPSYLQALEACAVAVLQGDQPTAQRHAQQARDLMLAALPPAAHRVLADLDLDMLPVTDDEPPAEPHEGPR